MHVKILTGRRVKVHAVNTVFWPITLLPLDTVCRVFADPAIETILLVPAFVETLAEQRVLFFTLAGSAFLIYLDPRHNANALKMMITALLVVVVACLCYPPLQRAAGCEPAKWPSAAEPRADLWPRQKGEQVLLRAGLSGLSLRQVSP